MKRAFPFILAAVLAGCAHTAHHIADIAVLPSIGDQFSPPTTAVVIFGNYNYTVRWHNMLFTVEVRGSTDRVMALYTPDARFHTPEGVRTGQSLTSLLAIPGTWSTSGGFACAYSLPSGWRANVSPPPAVPQSQPTPVSTPAPDQQYVIDPPFPDGSCPPSSGVVRDLELRS